MAWTLELWVEGATDATRGQPRRAAAGVGAASETAARDTEPAGALAPIVQRTLEEYCPALSKPGGRLPLEVHLLRGKLQERLQLPGRQRDFPMSPLARKFLQAFSSSRAKTPDTLVLAVWDCDGDAQRLRVRDEVHEWLRSYAWTGYVVVLCVQAVEAWLLADAGAFKKCFVDGPKEDLPGKPEDDPDPKTTLRELLTNYAAHLSESTAKNYRMLAEQIDLGVLARKCPQGYADFRRAISEFVVPAISPR